MTEVPALVDHLFRRHYGDMVASLTRVFGPARLALVEDVVSDSLVKALRVWPFAGIPANPRAWLVQVARNGALDAVRRHALAERKEAEVRAWAREQEVRVADPAHAIDDVLEDDALALIFTCCHPRLAFESRVALTLKTLCGFGVAEIARAFLAREPTIAQRLSRARKQLEEEAVVFAVPPAHELARRLDAVHEVLYLVFNEGYAAHAGEDLVRRDLVAEAIRLARLLAARAETATHTTHALLALMHLQGARLAARTDDVGELLTMARQDRARWDRASIARGLAHFERSIGGDVLSAYHVEAAIAVCHAAAPSYAETDWKTILARYDQLVALAPSPVVRLNRAVAVAKVEGIAAGLAALDELAEPAELAGYYLLPATRGHLLWSAGDRAGAVACFERALALGCSAPERALLARRREACAAGAEPEGF